MGKHSSGYKHAMIQRIKSYIRIPYSKMRKLLRNDFSPYKGLKKLDLLIADNIFPHPMSGFRMAEFTSLLENFDRSKIIVTPDSYVTIKTPIELHKVHIAEFQKRHPRLRNKITEKKGLVNVNAKLFYCVFIKNIYFNLPWLEKFDIPFAFTLFPGGGFQVNDPKCDEQLTRIFSSKMFRKVIVSMKFTQDYLIEKKFCKPEDVIYHFGGIVPQPSIANDLSKRVFYPEKNTFDICFCSSKYMPLGKDKGYDLFVDSAKELSVKFDFVRFHVIGGFNETDIDVTSLGEKIKFYGYQNIAELGDIYKKMDVFVSPNRPFVLNQGSFDGFPLGTAVEASFNGAVLVISDALKQNTHFSENEIVIVENETHSIVSAITSLIENPEKLRTISESGRKKMISIFSDSAQLEPKIAILKNLIATIS